MIEPYSAGIEKHGLNPFAVSVIDGKIKFGIAILQLPDLGVMFPDFKVIKP
ncbi:MAG: hypothetical protein HQM14_15600 [SAR324 cluster bacterium]|nr:hypothetical protein [SAR324 cluster bacterium]